MFSLEDLFYAVDDFCQIFEPLWHKQLLHHGLQQRDRKRQLCLSKVMTIVIGFHQQRYRTFKHYYTEHAQGVTRRLKGRLNQLHSLQTSLEITVH